MSDDKDLTTGRLKNCGLIDPESRYSKMSKNKIKSRRTFCIVLTLLISLMITVFGLSFAYLKMMENQRQTCTTEICLKSAILLVESMNKSVEPCEDFFQFACGRFERLHKVPKSASSFNWYDEVEDRISLLIRDFLEMDDSDIESSAVSKARGLYRSCIATGKTNTDWNNQLFQILNKIGFPFEVISSRQEVSSLSSILAGIKKQVNLDYLFVTEVVPDVRNRSINQIGLYKPSHQTTENNKNMSSRQMLNSLEIEKKEDITNDREEYIDENNYFKSYTKYVNDILGEIYKLQSNDCKIYVPTLNTENITQLLSFKDEYSKITKKIYDTVAEVPLIMTVDELQNFTNNITQNYTMTNIQIIDWKEFLNILFMDVKNVTLDFETDLILVYDIKYFEALIELICKSKDRFLINIWWEVIETLLPYTTNEIRFIQDRFYYETKGLEKNPSISLYCANSVNSMMGMAVSRLLLDMETIHNNTKMVSEMLKNIHWAFEKIIKELNWIDDETKQKIIYKALKMNASIGFPEFISDSIKLDYYYSEFEVIDNDYFGNFIRYSQRAVNNSLIRLREYNNFAISSWGLEPLQVNAVHWYQANSITVPAGILQFPLFGHDLQMLNYGFVGATLGHELTHGFDNTGRNFDQDGNENIWWTNQTIAEYEKRANCFIHHYESYLVPDIEKKISGKKTLNENIADNGGLNVALQAYRKFVNDNGEEPKLPGLEEYNNEQIFFLAFANNFCESATRESLYKSILFSHSPSILRVTGSLTNSDEFSQVWNCKKGSKMNPNNEKCKIW